MRKQYQEQFLESQKILRLALDEVSAGLTALKLYPFGIFGSEDKGVPHPFCAVNPRPVLLVHGLIHNPTAFAGLQRRMQACGWKNIFTINYATCHGSLEKMVSDLSQTIDRILATTRATKIDIVAHSLGGIVTRAYLSKDIGKHKIKHLITLGTPHRGSHISELVRNMTWGKIDFALEPESAFMTQLNHSPLPQDLDITNIYSPHDWTLWPGDLGYFEGLPGHSITNVSIPYLGHVSLLYSETIIEKVLQSLSADKVKLPSQPWRDRVSS